MTAQEYAKKEGFIGARPLTEWKGYKCFEAVIDDGEVISFIGFPQIILEKDGKCRMADYDEAWHIISKLE